MTMLRFINASYVKNMQNLVLISRINFKDNNAICKVCAKTKLTKKSCKLVKQQFELIELIHTNLVDLKQTMTRSGKKILCDFYR